jgi:DNA-binding transcriptional ArsR family regulator
LDRVFRAFECRPRRAIARLAAQEKCAISQFSTKLGISQAGASKHVRILFDAGLLSKTRQGRYRLLDQRVTLAYLKGKDAKSEGAHGTCEQQQPGPCCMTLRSTTLLGDRRTQ